MLSDWIKEIMEMIDICKNDREVPIPGMQFEALTVFDPGGKKMLHFGAVTVLGFISPDEMLVCSTDGRQYFSLRDGWGVKGNRLYALSVGWMQSFKKPVSASETEETEISGSCRGSFASMSAKLKRKRLQAIREVLKNGHK